jgi:hypothetical protein
MYSQAELESADRSRLGRMVGDTLTHPSSKAFRSKDALSVVEGLRILPNEAQVRVPAGRGNEATDVHRFIEAT